MNTEKKNKRECNGISIILATYNRKNLIEKAINSILNRKASYDINYEIVVAVDGMERWIHLPFNKKDK